MLNLYVQNISGKLLKISTIKFLLNLFKTLNLSLKVPMILQVSQYLPCFYIIVKAA